VRAPPANAGLPIPSQHWLGCVPPSICPPLLAHLPALLPLCADPLLAFRSPPQFGHQEPGSHAEIAEFAARFGSKFTMMGKVDVNGPQQHPVFAWLKANTPPQQGARACSCCSTMQCVQYLDKYRTARGGAG
jgi:hypothetical protein